MASTDSLLKSAATPVMNPRGYRSSTPEYVEGVDAPDSSLAGQGGARLVVWWR